MANKLRTRYRKLILVPGLLEPGFAFWPLRRTLQKDGTPVECWHDRFAFRSLDTSVRRLSEAIAGDPNEQGSIGIVTHSFGDWVARAAIAQTPQHRVAALVSLAPVMRAGFLPSLLYLLTGNLVPEIKVIMDPLKATANLDCDDRVMRMVVWSRFDESLRQVRLDHVNQLEVRYVMATHFSIAWQPNVRKLVAEFLAHCDGTRNA